jgi:DNA-binding NarL/FixJ family response regulator
MDTEAVGLKIASRAKRLVLVADNSLIVEALRAGLRKSGEFNLVGYAHPRRTSASAILAVQPDAVLIDDVDETARAIELVRDLRVEAEHLSVLILTLDMSPTWLGEVFDAGATAAISKAMHPLGLPTLLRATLNGHIFHRFSFSRPGTTCQSDDITGEDLPLTSREREILLLVAAGATNGDVARKLWVTEQTVKFHLRNIYRKLDVANRTEASHFAHVNGLVSGSSALAAAP